MIDHLVSPEWPIEIAGTQYTLDCSVTTLKAIQHAFSKDIVDVLVDVKQMRFDEHAKLIELGIKGSKQTPPSLEVIEQAIVDDIGIVETRWQLQGWLVIATTPKREREKKAKQVTEVLRKMAQTVDSLGEITSSSV